MEAQTLVLRTTAADLARTPHQQKYNPSKKRVRQPYKGGGRRQRHNTRHTAGNIDKHPHTANAKHCEYGHCEH